MRINQKQKFSLDISEILVSVTIVLSVASGFLFLGGIRPATTLAAALSVNQSKVDIYNTLNTIDALDVDILDHNGAGILECEIDLVEIESQMDNDQQQIEYVQSILNKDLSNIADLDELGYDSEYIALETSLREFLEAKLILLNEKYEYNQFLVNFLQLYIDYCESGQLDESRSKIVTDYINQNSDKFGFTDAYMQKISNNPKELFNAGNQDVLFGMKFLQSTQVVDDKFRFVNDILITLDKVESNKYKNDFRISKSLVFFD